MSVQPLLIIMCPSGQQIVPTFPSLLVGQEHVSVMSLWKGHFFKPVSASISAQISISGNWQIPSYVQSIPHRVEFL